MTKPRKVGFKVHGPRSKQPQLEFLTERWDIYLRRERGEWTVDIFDATVKDTDEAHRDSLGFDTLEAALEEIGAWCG